jgi:hypothetical protein
MALKTWGMRFESKAIEPQMLIMFDQSAAFFDLFWITRSCFFLCV